jgi:hypothetical protein
MFSYFKAKPDALTETDILSDPDIQAGITATEVCYRQNRKDTVDPVLCKLIAAFEDEKTNWIEVGMHYDDFIDSINAYFANTIKDTTLQYNPALPLQYLNIINNRLKQDIEPLHLLLAQLDSIITDSVHTDIERAASFLATCLPAMSLIERASRSTIQEAIRAAMENETDGIKHLGNGERKSKRCTIL